MNCITIKAFRNGNLGDVTITEESFYQMMDTFLNEKTTNGFIKPIDFLAETVEAGVAKKETINMNPIEQASEIRTFIHNATTTAYNKLVKDFEVKVEDFTKRIEESVSNDQLNALQNEINALDLKYETTETKTIVAKQLDRLINAKRSVIEKADFIKNNLIVNDNTTIEDVQNALNNGVNVVVKSEAVTNVQTDNKNIIPLFVDILEGKRYFYANTYVANKAYYKLFKVENGVLLELNKEADDYIPEEYKNDSGYKWNPVKYMDEVLFNYTIPKIKYSDVLTYVKENQALLDRQNDVKDRIFKPVQADTNSAVTVEEIYSQLGDKTESKNVVIDGVAGRKPASNNNVIVAYRTKDNNFLEALKQDNAVGNPWGPYSLYKTAKDGTAVKEFIAWMTGEKHTDILQNYRQAIIDKINSGEFKNKQILYYEDIKRPSHATALDFLINKYNWSNDSTGTNSAFTENPFITSKIQQKVYHADKRVNLNEETLVDDLSQIFPSGVFFSDNLEYAKNYAKEIDGVIYEAYVDAQSFYETPYKEEIQELGRNPEELPEKYDSVVHKSNNEQDDKYGKVGTEIVVYNSKQIKIVNIISNENLNNSSLNNVTEIQNYLTEKDIQFEEKEVNGELVKVYKADSFNFENVNSENAEVIEFVKTNPAVKKEDTLNEGQKEAVTKALKILNDVQHDDIYDDMFLLSGIGGSGKTYTTEVILSNTKKSGMTSHVAPTWNAVNEILKASPDGYNAITLASFLGTELSEPDENGVEKFILFDDEKLEKLKKAGMLPAVFTSSLFVLDECSMLGGNNQKPKLNSEGKLVSSDVWQALLYRLEQRKRMGYGRPSKMLFIGDYAQIPPVGTEPDKDAFIVEKLTEKETTHHVLTENMRTGKKDLSTLHEVYRKEIDKAIEGVKKGIPSSTSVRANPIPFNSRVNSENLTWENNINKAVENFVKFYNQDVFNVTNVVFVNYNTYTRPETQNLIKLIRTKLFGSNSNRLYNEKELVLLKGNLKADLNSSEEVTFRNETRFILQDIVSNKTEEIQHTFKVWNTVNKGYDYKTIKLTLKGSSAKFTTQYGKQTVTFNSFIPDTGVFESIFGKYDKTVKGYKVDGIIIPYGVAKEIKENYPVLQYGYVVNGHKVQGSSYNHTFVDEANILKAGNLTNKEKLNSLYTAASRPKFTLTMVNESQPALPAYNPNQKLIDELEAQLKLVNKPSQEYDAIEIELNCLKS